MRWLALAAGLALTAACGTHPTANSSSAAPPWRVCGTVLYDAPSGPPVVDVPSWPAARPLTDEFTGSPLYLRLTDGCGGGAALQVRPSYAASISKAAEGRHGLAGVVLEAHRSRFSIRVTDWRGGTKVLRVRLD